jgi:2-O-(6-phospho-alpha-D-mannosyl)-D-glycerate hydrolase
MRCVVVSHFHWDREWYRTFEAFRGRLVDAIDRVLELLDADPGYRFLLDGQTVVLEDYLAVRPEKRLTLARHVREHRLSIGPWYVQPDSLLPSGEAHVRNLLRGRRVGQAFGPVSVVGYVPDSFGHPAQLPQILAGFGISTFVYWRGNGDEIDTVGPVYRWGAPDGSTVAATLLRQGYMNAASLPADLDEAVRRLTQAATLLAEGHDGPVLLMNGIDHQLPDAHVDTAVAALAQATGWTVERGFLEDAVAGDGPGLREFRGALTGARIANLTPGVWSTRMPLKLGNRRCETLLQGWVEPWAALGGVLGLADERQALARAWEEVLKNQAHDSLCGCSIDAVANAVLARFDTAEGLAEETLLRLLERLAGRGLEREVPWTVEQEVAVFNPSPHARTDVVRVPLDVHGALRLSVGQVDFHPLPLAVRAESGFCVGGEPVRVVPSADPSRTRWLPGPGPVDLEFVAADVPAFGWRRYALTPAPPTHDAIDDGRSIEANGIAVHLTDDGTLRVRFTTQEYGGLLGVEDQGDRGDTYDFDPVSDARGATLTALTWRRLRHPSGLQRLEVDRTFTVPAALDADREQRAASVVPLGVHVQVCVAPGLPRVDLAVTIESAARDHRVRLLFPTGTPTATFRAATTFDVIQRSTARPDATRWVHPAPSTFAHQGWVSANGLMVVAPGLPEAEVTPEGTIAVTLLRAVGTLAHFDLRSRPIPAGPFMAVEGAQMHGALQARLALLAGNDPAAAQDAELGLRGVIAGPHPVLAPTTSLLSLEPSDLILSALKPAEEGGGLIVRVLNPTDGAQTATVRFAFPVSSARAVRLDEEAAVHTVTLAGDRLQFEVPPHALRSVLLR